MKIIVLIASSLTVLALVACGGSSAPTNLPEAPAVPSGVPAAVPTPPGGNATPTPPVVPPAPGAPAVPVAPPGH